jgi:hypothetical protein
MRRRAHHQPIRGAVQQHGQPGQPVGRRLVTQVLGGVGQRVEREQGARATWWPASIGRSQRPATSRRCGGLAEGAIVGGTGSAGAPGDQLPVESRASGQRAVHDATKIGELVSRWRPDRLWGVTERSARTARPRANQRSSTGSSRFPLAASTAVASATSTARWEQAKYLEAACHLRLLDLGRRSGHMHGRQGRESVSAGHVPHAVTRAIDIR